MRENHLTPNQIYDHLLRVISSKRFLQKQGLGNEVPFFICPYLPSQAIDMEKSQKQLVKQLKREGITVLDINLYDLSVNLLQNRNIWSRIIETETTISKDALKELLKNVLDPETYLIPAIAATIDEQRDFHVMFLSGVGEIYPFIRSHTILNNLQSTAKQQPTVMFFPGAYSHSQESGASLELFGRLRDDKYYRAFNILHYNV